MSAHVPLNWLLLCEACILLFLKAERAKLNSVFVKNGLFGMNFLFVCLI